MLFLKFGRKYKDSFLDFNEHETWNVFDNNLFSSILASCLLNNYVLDVFHVQHNQTAELQNNFKLFLK